MKIKIFISFTEKDRQLLDTLLSLFSNIENFEPHVVERQRTPNAESLSNLVEEGIKQCHYFVPIITKNSQQTQWVNQEIGYAKAITDVNIIPIIETEIKDTLKGFIHNQIQLSYRFSLNGSSKTFSSCCSELIKDIIQLDTLPKKKYEESSEAMMKRKEVKPYLEFKNLIKSPPLNLKADKAVSAYFKNSGLGDAYVYMIEGYEILGSSLLPIQEKYPTPIRVKKNEKIEVPMKILKQINPHSFKVLITYFDMYDHRYHQLAGHENGKKLESGPVLVKLASS